ncbi:D-alanyl-D-alanine carboxypeptidase family protein [Roseomonas sp. BN140053]|uniref:D-alanyl-D-alanine carboxypeptidase family protein n=1 Tax=Roseomonas sp. BN140053 TaxID=3391898 RepID=UPI0039E7A4ED
MTQGWVAARRWRIATCALALALLGLGIRPAAAQIGSDRYSSIVIDARSGNQLSGASPDELRHPASLTKMMTLYMLFDALRDGQLTLNSRLTMSYEAASRMPSKLGIPPGTSISVDQAILSLVTLSANDVAVMIGETLGGTEERFAQMMTLRARQLGMSSSTFRNASGLPDPEQVTTARDMATLGRRLFIDYQDRYHYFATQQFQYGARRIRSHNHMLETVEGVDGIKTGFINASGFNIVTSAQRQGQRVVAAVFGGASWVERDRHAAMLLDDGFARLGVTPSEPSVPLMARAAPLLSRGAMAASLGENRRWARAEARAEARLERNPPAPLPQARLNGNRASTRLLSGGIRLLPRAEAAPAPRLVRAAPVLRGRRVMEQGDGGSTVRLPARAAAAAPRAAAAPARRGKPEVAAAPVRRPAAVVRLANRNR